MIARAADGTGLHYVLDGTGIPIVLVGGRSSTIDGAWWRYRATFQPGFRVIAFDHRGAGKSDKPDVPYTTAMLAGDALAVLDATGERSAHWFGVSLGGMALQELALAHPSAVRSLVLAATSCGGRETLRPLSAADEASLRASPSRRLATLYTPAFLVSHPEWVAEDARHFGKMPLATLIRQDQAAQAHRACDRVGAIRTPVLIVHGAADRLISVERAEELHRLIQRSELRIFSGGHQVLSENFAEVTGAVGAFIQRVEAAAARS